MAEPAGRYSAGAASQESVGGLVSLAVKDITQLVRYELDLAKMELKTDVRRIGIGAALFGLSAFVGCLILMLLCFALAYGLMAVGILSVKKFGGLPRTRRTVSDDIAILRRGDGAGAPPRTPVR